MALVKIKKACPICKAEHEELDFQQMSDKEYFIEWWTPTVGKEAAEQSWIEKEKQIRRAAPMVSSDIGGYVSQIDGSYIESRSKHREHLKRHGMVELGNDVPKQQKVVELSRKSQEQRKQTIAEIAYSKLRRSEEHTSELQSH